MLQKRLEQESRDTHRRQMRFAGALAGGALLVAAFFAAVLAFERGLFGTADDAATAPPPAEAAPAAGNPSADPPDAAGRERFKDALAAFRAEIEPRVEDADFGRWNGPARQQILEGRDAAIAQHGAGAYADAVDTLAAATATAQRELAARDAAFEEAMAAARTALAADDHAEASLRVARALEIYPGSAEAQALDERVRSLPGLLAAIEKAAVARVENDLRGEAEHLAAALAIDSSRQELAARLAAVRGDLRERRFAGFIEAGLADLRGRDLEGARRNLAEARAMFPRRDETGVLADGLAALERGARIEALADEARRAEAVDDWAEAAGVWNRAASLAPDDAEISESLARAQALNDVRRRIERHLAEPRRLASQAVAADVRALLARAEPFVRASPELARRASKLSETVAAYGVKVPVRVISDGLTDIFVRGVGVVGATTDRTIELHPGSYTFEGIRPGYRAKLVRIDIPPGAADLVLVIIPDEPI